MDNRTLADVADYIAQQLKLLDKDKKYYCCRCGRELARVYYKLPDLCGEYCDECIHEIYRKYGLTFFCKDRKEDNENKT